jgi:hypothetical protein
LGIEAKNLGKQLRLADGVPVQQKSADANEMASYGPAFLQKAIGIFEGGRVSVNAKILRNLIPAMDPAEAYVGLGWAGWCIAQNTTPETQLQVGHSICTLLIPMANLHMEETYFSQSNDDACWPVLSFPAPYKAEAGAHALPFRAGKSDAGSSWGLLQRPGLQGFLRSPLADQ